MFLVAEAPEDARGVLVVVLIGGVRAYLWPEKPTFLGFLIMVSIFFLKGSVLGAKGRVYGFRV